MASRENMGLQIWLMVTVIFAVGMAVAASVFYYTDSSNKQRLAAAQTQAATDATTISNLNYEIQALKKMIQGPPEGLNEIPLSPGSEVKKLVDAFNVDMATYASNLDAGDRSYSKMLNCSCGGFRYCRSDFCRAVPWKYDSSYSCTFS